MPECCKYAVTPAWYSCYPITTIPGSGKVFPYYVEMVVNKEHYPDGRGSWPRCPVCGQKYPMEKFVAEENFKSRMIYKIDRMLHRVVLFCERNLLCYELFRLDGNCRLEAFGKSVWMLFGGKAKIYSRRRRREMEKT